MFGRHEIRLPLGLSKGCPACEDNAVCPPPCFPPPAGPKMLHFEGTRSSGAGPRCLFLKFPNAILFEARCKALWNRFEGDLGPVLRRLWDLKSVIKASSMPFDGRYTRSLILRTPHSVLKGFCH